MQRRPRRLQRGSPVRCGYRPSLPLLVRRPTRAHARARRREGDVAALDDEAAGLGGRLNPAPSSPRSMSDVAPRGDHQIRVSKAAERPRPRGSRPSQERIDGCERSGGAGALPDWSAMFSSILSEASLNAITGAPATRRSTSARTSVNASSVVNAGRLRPDARRNGSRYGCRISPMRLVDNDGLHDNSLSQLRAGCLRGSRPRRSSGCLVNGRDGRSAQRAGPSLLIRRQLHFFARPPEVAVRR